MWSSSSSKPPEPLILPGPGGVRRRLLVGLGVAGLAGLAGLAGRAAAQTAGSPPVLPIPLIPPGPAAPAALRRWGSGAYRRFSLHIYTATLWAGDDPLRPPLALRLDYQRRLRGEDIAQASIDEMRRLLASHVSLPRWGEALGRIFPDVQPGDHLLGLYWPEGAYFYQGERLLGSVLEPAFAEAFFAIWLDPRTRAPGLRAALLKGEAA